jgi:hypothetical protein
MRTCFINSGVSETQKDELISESDDEENEKIKQKVLKKIREIENQNIKN